MFKFITAAKAREKMPNYNHKKMLRWLNRRIRWEAACNSSSYIIDRDDDFKHFWNFDDYYKTTDHVELNGYTVNFSSYNGQLWYKISW